MSISTEIDRVIEGFYCTSYKKAGPTITPGDVFGVLCPMRPADPP